MKALQLLAPDKLGVNFETECRDRLVKTILERKVKQEVPETKEMESDEDVDDEEDLEYASAYSVSVLQLLSQQSSHGDSID